MRQSSDLIHKSIGLTRFILDRRDGITNEFGKPVGSDFGLHRCTYTKIFHLNLGVVVKRRQIAVKKLFYWDRNITRHD